MTDPIGIPVLGTVREGESEIKDIREMARIEPRMALCRCGASENKPFCDGSHAKIGFTSEKQADRVEDRRESYEGEGVTIHDNYATYTSVPALGTSTTDAPHFSLSVDPSACRRAYHKDRGRFDI